MRVEWHGQSAFTLTAPEATVFIDPFSDFRHREQTPYVFGFPDAG